MRNDRGKSALTRRTFVGKLAAGAAGAAVAVAAGGRRAGALTQSARGAQESHWGGGELADPREAQALAAVGEGKITPRSEPPPWQLLRPLGEGSKLSDGWRVAELSAVENGSCVLTLENERGRGHRVHLCRNDGRPQGLVYTKRLDLVVMNGGQGELPTDEGLAQAVAEVAHVLAGNEGEHGAVLRGLLAQAERVSLYGGAAQLR